MNALETFLAARPFGFIKDADLPELIRLHRLCQCVVRCGGGRFVCAAQDVAHFVKCVEAGGDYVRDVSVSPQEIERAPAWQPERQPAAWPAMPQIVPIRTKPASVTPHPATRRQTIPDAADFNEADCSGAFDGNSVQTDAEGNL